MSEFIQKKFQKLRKMRDTIRDNLLNSQINFEMAECLVEKYIAELNITMEHLENKHNFRRNDAERTRYLTEATDQHIEFLRVVVEKNKQYSKRFGDSVEYILLAACCSDILKPVPVKEKVVDDIALSEKNRFKNIMDELAAYLNPFKGKKEDFANPGLYYFYRFLQFFQIVFIPLRLIAFIVKKLFEGLFFVLRHLMFLNAKDDDKDLNAFQHVIKEIGIGFDNFLSKNFDAITRPLEALTGMIQAIGELINRKVKGEKSIFWNLLCDLWERFKKHPIRNTTEIILFIATIVVSVVVPVLLTGPAIAVVPMVPRHCVLPAAVAGMAATHAATPVVAAVGIGATLQAAASISSEKTGIDHEIILLEQNLSFFDPIEDKEAYERISQKIAQLQNKLKYCHQGTESEANDFHIQETIELLKQNLTFYSAETDPEMYESIQKSIQEHEAQLSMYRELAPVLNNEDFVWEKHFSEASVINPSAMFSTSSNNSSSEEEKPSLQRSLSVSDFRML